MLSSHASYAWTQEKPLALDKCQSQAPHGLPSTAKKGTMICRYAYISLNDTTAKLPIWLSYTLTPDHAIGCVARSNNFTYDKSLAKGKRAELSDYAKSGYDAGHIAPNNDMSFDVKSEHESFLLSNAVPQLPHTNRGNWKELETSIRGWVIQLNQSFTIYAGPIYDNTDSTIGTHHVVVPHAFYKIVINNQTKEVAGWVFPNSAIGDNDIVTLRTSVSKITKLTSISFKLPTKSKEIDPGKEWPVNFGALTKASAAKCRLPI
jgi:endonuclease G